MKGGYGAITDEKLLKGAEFGFKAAGEVSKDVFEIVAWNAFWAWNPLPGKAAETITKNPGLRAGAEFLINKSISGVRAKGTFDSAEEDTIDLSRRNEIKNSIYKKD